MKPNKIKSHQWRATQQAIIEKSEQSPQESNTIKENLINIFNAIHAEIDPIIKKSYSID